ncbi:MAG: hydantoinase/oxoprolinase family protein [Chromatiales bacterium]|nr:hydantoinase/oxoprolinase family protein [Chromatiales bacterium]
MRWLGIDTGGTFTDFVLYDGESLQTFKCLSTPHAPEQAILTGVRALLGDAMDFAIVHGSTVATNAVLEGKGARTAFVTNRGFRDLLTIGRQAREHLYDLQPPVVEAPVPRELCLETAGRLDATGNTLEPLTEAALEALAQSVRASGVEAVAVCMLFAYLDPTTEQRIAARLAADGLFVCHSAAVLPQMREYERGMATWLNARVGPLMQGYIGRLGAALPDVPLAVMQSSGETMDARQAGRNAARLLLSGPAGGLVGARSVAAAAGAERVLSFDMGGTSTDVALIDGAPSITSEGRIGRYPVAVPMVEMHTIGAGGGSIARVDAGGMLLVGPESAGADPGPACYGRGGLLATVTDANLVLGRIPPQARLGGSLQLDIDAARTVVAGVGKTMGMTPEDAALGIVRIANAHMAQALRVISVERGVDPRTFSLAAFGGAGGLHVCALADALGLTEALVPAYAGVLSALGMLAAPPGRQLTQAFSGDLADTDPVAVDAGLAKLEQQARAMLVADGIPDSALVAERRLDLRYRGQSFTLDLAWNGAARTQDDFHTLHAERYGHALAYAVEIVNLRVRLTAPGRALHWGVTGRGGGMPLGKACCHGLDAPVPVYERGALAGGAPLQGPAIVLDEVATTWLAPGWTARLHGSGSLLLRGERP